jgi:hypothetical protein
MSLTTLKQVPRIASYFRENTCYSDAEALRWAVSLLLGNKSTMISGCNLVRIGFSNSLSAIALRDQTDDLNYSRQSVVEEGRKAESIMQLCR